ncbi:MAG: FHA domain-containing protein [Alloprevotella sp.]|nr:FHA domain-containing protein [Alloprevotella sp.]
MKKIRCPRCDEAILFDETRFEPGRVLVFACPSCQKQFRVRMPAPKPLDAEEERKAYGTLIVLENAFQLRQEIPLYEGENVLGREVKGTAANAAFKTVDPSIDTSHAVVSVRCRQGRTDFFVRDFPSGTGTFVGGELLHGRESVSLEDGTVLTLGAATLIFRDDTQE